MAASSVLDFHLGKAIRAEVKKEVDLIRKDLELDRQVRLQLEEQVNLLQQNAADVSNMLRDPSKLVAGMAAAAAELSAQGPGTLPREVEDNLMKEMLSVDLKALFGKYNDRSKSGLAGKDFAKLCLDAALMDRIDADLIFSQVMGTARRMDFEHFEVALERVAEKKNKEVSNLRRQLARLPGPNLNDITVPDDVRLHDDQTTYTGICSQKSAYTPQRQDSVTNRSTNELWRNELRTEQSGMSSAPRMMRSESSVSPLIQDGRDSRNSSFCEGQSPKSYPKYALVPAGLQTPTNESPKGQTRSAIEGMSPQGGLAQRNFGKIQDPALSTFAERRARFGMAPEESPPTTPLPMEITQLAQDIDRKVGVVLRDIDQRLEATQAYSDRVASAAAGAATDHSKALFSTLTKQLDAACNRQDESLASIRSAQTQCATLQQKCDFLTSELDELRLHIGLTARGQRSSSGLFQTGNAVVLPPDGRFVSAGQAGVSI